jgi:hypothetical protein
MRSSLKMKRFGVLAVVAAALLLAGCHFAGGGTVRSATGSGKAQFSFNLDCAPNTFTATGALTYVDVKAGVFIHGTGTFAAGPAELPCATNALDEEYAGYATFEGTYTTFKGTTKTGTFTLTVTPGKSGPLSPGGTLCLTLDGGLTYHNCSPVLAGQIEPIGGPNA